MRPHLAARGAPPAPPFDRDAGRVGVQTASADVMAREMPDAMWRRVEAITAKAPPKPEFGSPCNGCGFCCAAEPCGIARRFIPGCGEEGPCPAMKFEGGWFWCGMVRRPGHCLGLPACGTRR